MKYVCWKTRVSDIQRMLKIPTQKYGCITTLFSSFSSACIQIGLLSPATDTKKGNSMTTTITTMIITTRDKDSLWSGHGRAVSTQSVIENFDSSTGVDNADESQKPTNSTLWGNVAWWKYLLTLWWHGQLHSSWETYAPSLNYLKLPIRELDTDIGQMDRQTETQTMGNDC